MNCSLLNPYFHHPKSHRMANSQIRISVNNLKESLEFYKAALAPAHLYPSFNRSDGTAIGFSKRFLRYNLSPSLWLITAGASLTSDLDSDLNPLPNDTTAMSEGAELTEGLLKDSEVEGLESGSGRFADDANSNIVTRGVYIGIAVNTRLAVDGFYEASLAAGGKGVTPPGVHPRKAFSANSDARL
ncbi:hypothetical protein BJ165DRAFT_1468680 [Panaeolus papilionaceus]|nr:hypothetical protein BJ165DRAFT_1468680 [Panaeolus papilionaceus]